MKLKIFRWVIVVVLVIVAFALGIEFEKFTNHNSCLDMGEKTPQGSHQICLSQE